MANTIKVTVTQDTEAVAKARAAQAGAENALAMMIEHVGSFVIREKNGGYESRPSIDIFPNVIWFGQSDATLHNDFVPFDPETGFGDIWIEVIL